MTRTPALACAAWLIVACAAHAASPSPPAAGGCTDCVEGVVRISSSMATEKERKRYESVPQAFRTAEPAGNPMLDVVVFIEGVKGGSGKRPAPSIAQRKKAFQPRVLPVKAGTSVQFPNQDPFYHDVFSYSKLKKFDLGRYPQGQSKSLVFDKPGVVELFCDIHSTMKGFVLVLDSDAFCVPQEDGRYRIERLPPGKYKVVAWHPSFEPQEKPITIERGGRVEAEFDF